MIRFRFHARPQLMAMNGASTKIMVQSCRAIVRKVSEIVPKEYGEPLYLRWQELLGGNKA